MIRILKQTDDVLPLFLCLGKVKTIVTKRLKTKLKKIHWDPAKFANSDLLKSKMEFVFGKGSGATPHGNRLFDRSCHSQ